MKIFTKITFMSLALCLAFGIAYSQTEEADPNPVIVPNGGAEAPGDVIFQLDVEGITGDNTMLGCEFDGEHLWVTGRGGSGSSDHRIYEIDPVAGTLLNDYPQGTTSAWGMRDLAYDEANDMLYAGDDDGFYSIDPSNGTVTTVFTGPPMGLTIRALAFDGTYFWAKDFGNALIKFDMSGSVIDSWSISNSCYGAAYDPNNDCIWLHATGAVMTEFVQVDMNGSLTGVVWELGDPAGSGGIVGGAFHDDGNLVSGKVVLGAVTQGTPDMCYGMELEDSSGPSSIFEDDFESYNSGQQLCVQSTDWTTWSGTPGTAEDPYIVTDQANSGSQSVVIEGTNDVVYPMNDYTSGHYVVSFYIYVPTGFNGYFNTLQDFAGANSEWGMQVFFDVGGTGSIDGGGQAAATFSYSYDTWIAVEVDVDLDSDWAEFSLDGNFVHGWVWSSGSFGTGSLNQLGASNFYAWADNGPPKFYIDDYMFAEAGGPPPVLDPPENLEAEVNGNDVTLTWEEPGGGGTVEELIYDNGTNTGAYSYQGFTMSTHMSPSGPCQVLTLKYWTSIQAGDNTFNATLFEWMGTEPGTTIIYEENVTAVDDDWMEVDISGQNITFTGDFVAGFGSINGTTFVGYDAGFNNGRSWDFDNASSTWATWNEAYLIRAIVQYSDGTVAEIGGPAEIVKSTPVAGPQTTHPTDYSAVVPVKPIDNMASSSKALLGYNVYRDGTMINTSLVTDLTYLDMDLPIGYYEYYVTAFYDEGESDPSNFAYADITVGMDENSLAEVNIYPNPAGEFIYVNAQNNIERVQIFDFLGKLVLENQPGSAMASIDLNGINSGVYLIRVETASEVITSRIIIE